MDINKEREEINKGGMYYVIKNVNTLPKLQDEWNKYNALHQDLRHRSDEKSIELYGKDNEQRYEEMKSKLLAKDDFDISEVPLESARITRQRDNISRISVKYTKDKVDEAIYWSIRSMRVIIVPVDTVEELDATWNEFLRQHRQLQRESDWKSLELFGVNNQDHYEYLKSKFLVNDIDDDPDEIVEPPNDQFPRTNLFEMSSFEYACLQLNESSGIDKDVRKMELSLYKPTALSESIKKDKLFSNNETTSISFIDNLVDTSLGCMTADEMMDLGVYSNDNYYSNYKAFKIGENYSSRDWFDNYVKLCGGVVTEKTEELSRLRYTALDNLVTELHRDPDNDEIKQKILELGWNPEIPYTVENRLLAYKNTKRKLKEYYNEFQIIDISDIDNISYLDEAEVEEEEKELYPVHIVTLSSTSLFGKAIKKFTHSIYSHAAISFDTKMDKLYSYNVDKKLGGGLSFESLKGYGEGSKVLINTIFLTKKDMIKLKSRLDYYISNYNNTHYSFSNIFNIMSNQVKDYDLDLVCSQFVDKMLKWVGIDLTHKPSNLVTPADLSKAKSKKIYTLYKGDTLKYNQKQADRKIAKLKASAKVFKEYFLNNECKAIIDLYELEPIGEAKEFPLQFDKEGNLLIKNMKRINYNEEYAKSHKLLKLYEKSNNIEGMKFEISKLWFMYNLLEKIRFNKKLSEVELKSVNDSRARIQNDFQKYLAIIQKSEPDFNFNSYYEDTPFSDAAYKINGSTLKYTTDFIKKIIF